MSITSAVSDPKNAPVVNAIRTVAQQLGVDQNLALATAYHESGFDPTRVGDQGTSFGIFQLHRGGELGSLSPQQAFDPTRNAQVSLSVVKQAASAGGTPGQIAARAQRPANPAAYAQTVDSLYLQLTGGVPATPGIPALAGNQGQTLETAAQGQTYDEGSITMPSVLPNIPRAALRRVAGGAVLVGAAVIGGAGLFLLLGRRAPGPARVVQQVIESRTTRQTAQTKQEGLLQRQQDREQSRRRRESESVRSPLESEEPF